MARLPANGWRDTRRIRGTPQWQTGSNYDGGYSRGDSGSRYDSSSTREPDASPRHSEASSRHDNHRLDERQRYENSPQNDLISAFDKKITSVQQAMSSSLQEATSKENEKFDLIFSILIELQRRQAQLEESLQSLKTQLQRGSAPVVMQMGAPAQQQQPGQMQNGSGSPSGSLPATPQVSSPMGQQQMCFPAGQMPMGQQCGNMMGPDGSMQMVFVMNSQNGNQMPYAVPQMMVPGGPMSAMQQQMPAHFVPQEQGNFGEGYQIGCTGGCGAQGDLADTTMDSSGGQPPQDGVQQVETLVSEA